MMLICCPPPTESDSDKICSFFDKSRGQVEKGNKSLCDPTESGRAARGSVIFLFGLTIMSMADAYGKITGFVKEPICFGRRYQSCRDRRRRMLILSSK
jgi:hypothetical protein